MEIISLRNFKSYENHTIPHLNSRINVILGSNGQGKSNLFKGTISIIQPLHSYSLIRLLSTLPNITLISMSLISHLESLRPLHKTSSCRTIHSSQKF